MGSVEEREDKYIALLREGLIDKQDFMKLMDKLEQPSTPVVITSKKKEKQKVSFRMPKVLKRALPFALVIIVFVSVLSFYSPSIRADAPTVAYSSIGNGATFVDVVPGEGVYLTVNVSDGDGNLQSVDIYSNSTGSWASIYGSGALGGVAFHNTSSFLVSDWTGSWTVYYFNITGNDGSDTEFHYSFTTEYVWGEPDQAYVNNDNSVYWGMTYKNDTGEYYLVLEDDDANQVQFTTSSDGTDWSLQTVDDIHSTLGYLGVHGFHTYDGKPSFFYGYYSNSFARWQYASYDGASWSSSQLSQYTKSDHDVQGSLYAIGCDIAYFDGDWKWFASTVKSDGLAKYLTLYHGTPPTTWTSINQFRSDSYGTTYANYQPSLEIFDSYLVLAYSNRDASTGPIRWQIFDGVTLTDKGNMEDSYVDGLDLVYDPDHDQVVCVYSLNGDLYYRVLSDIDTGWSEAYLLCDNSGTFKNPKLSYIDGRVVVTVANNRRGDWDIYNLYAPDYVSADSGTNTSYNRIQFPDAQPDATNVFSEVVGFKNINSRDILNVTWHFEDIGDLDVSSNIRVWTNMSGGWASIGTCDASGDLAELDISGEMLGGGEWTPGMITYWKFEILDVGGIAETLHATDEDIYMLVDLADE